MWIVKCLLKSQQRAANICWSSVHLLVISIQDSTHDGTSVEHWSLTFAVGRELSRQLFYLCFSWWNSIIPDLSPPSPQKTIVYTVTDTVQGLGSAECGDITHTAAGPSTIALLCKFSLIKAQHLIFAEPWASATTVYASMKLQQIVTVKYFLVWILFAKCYQVSSYYLKPVGL